MSKSFVYTTLNAIYQNTQDDNFSKRGIVLQNPRQRNSLHSWDSFLVPTANNYFRKSLIQVSSHLRDALCN